MTVILNTSLTPEEVQQKIRETAIKKAEYRKKTIEAMKKRREKYFGKAFLNLSQSPLKIQQEWRNE